MKYRIGLDVGITSVGWAVVENNENGEPIRIVDLGSRIFDAAENPKDGSPLAKERRDARELRRRIRRKKHRITRTKYLLEKYNILSVKEIEKMYTENDFHNNVLELRVRALDEKLSNKELARILISMVKKRGYKSNSKSEEQDNKNDAGKLLTATKENEQLMQEKGYRTIGEMYLKDDKFKQELPDGTTLLKVRNTPDEYKNTVLRKNLLEEIQLILQKQKSLNPLVTQQFIDKYIEIFQSQRNFDEGPGEPSPYAGNQIEKMLGKCTFESNEIRAPKATYTFEYFKALQDLNHIKIISRINDNETKRTLTVEEKEILIDLFKDKSNVTYDTIRKALNLNISERFNMLAYKSTREFTEEIHKEAEKNVKLKEFESYHKIKTTLHRVEKGYIRQLSTEELDKIAYALTVYKNDTKRQEYFKEQNLKISNEMQQELCKLSFTKTGHLSITAMKKIIPYLEQGMTYDKAVNQVYEDFRGNIPTTKKRKLALKDIEQGITNPVVRRAVTQAIKVINAITLKYGEPDVVVIELARDVGKSFIDRKVIDKQITENQKMNERIVEQIKELGKEKPTGQDIVKFKLWKEQGEICVYSGKMIKIEDLFTEAVDVDHIIPYSQCFDDTYKNKVLVLASENRQKGNRIPYVYLKETGKNLDEYEVRVNNFVKDYKKRERLLKKEFTREDAQNWKDRNLQDTRYISRLLYNLIRNHLKFSDNPHFKRKVFAISGGVTAHIRKRLDIVKDREAGDLHHAIDAVIIAITSQGMINKITQFYQYEDGKFMQANGEYVDLETGEVITKKEYEEQHGDKFPEPWRKFKKELEIRATGKTKERIIECLEAEEIYTYENYDDVRPIFVSRMPRRKIKGTAHLETVRGVKFDEKDIKTVTKTSLTQLKLDKYGEIQGYSEKQRKDDRLLYSALKQRLHEYNGDAKEAFKETFYKPKSDGTAGPVVKKVQIEEKITLGVVLNDGKAIAANGNMIRIDVFHVQGDGYYFVPIYVSDTVKEQLPNRAVVAGKPYSEWKEMKEEDFLFSLYPNDLVQIRAKNKIKLNKVNCEKETQEVDEMLGYYVKAGISVAAITLINHDKSYEQQNQGIKTLADMKKFTVDVLGNYQEVKLPEKRKQFRKKMRGI